MHKPGTQLIMNRLSQVYLAKELGFKLGTWDVVAEEWIDHFYSVRIDTKENNVYLREHEKWRIVVTEDGANGVKRFEEFSKAPIDQWVKLNKQNARLLEPSTSYLVQLKNMPSPVHDVALFKGKDSGGNREWIFADVNLDESMIEYFARIQPIGDDEDYRTLPQFDEIIEPGETE